MLTRSWTILPRTYRDSATLMRLSAEVSARPGIRQAVAVMGTENNLANLAAAGLVGEDAWQAGPADLVLVVEAECPDAARDALQVLRAGLVSARRQAFAQAGEALPLTLESAARRLPGANLVLISVPGEYAAAEATRALHLGMDVFLFSDNVPMEQEIELKMLASRLNRLVMGPDCGTAIIDGIPLGFANRVRRGSIGIAGAAGTGIQEATCIIHRAGLGISHAYGTGGRDLDDRVGGITMLRALELLGQDPDTRVVLVIAKSAGVNTTRVIQERAAFLGKPVVLVLLGAGDQAPCPAGVSLAVTLEEGAREAAALALGTPVPEPDTSPAKARMRPGGRWIRGLFSGGTLCTEAATVLGPYLGEFSRSWPARKHALVDLGDDIYTRGRPHPMIDPGLRNQWIQEQAREPDVGIILLDVVLGYGSHPDPAGAVAAAIARLPTGDRPCFIASVCGTAEDPQGLEAQESKLKEAGVLVQPTAAAAARLAARALGGAI